MTRFLPYVGIQVTSTSGVIRDVREGILIIIRRNPFIVDRSH